MSTKKRYVLKMIFIDRAPVSGIRRTSDGYAVAEVPVGRTGIQDYAGWEVGRPDLARVSVYRPPETVFADSYVASMAYKPVTNDHPAVPVTADNWKDFAVGSMGPEIRKDEANGLVYVPMLMMDASAINDVESGKREVSLGYTCDLEWTEGVTPDGAPFQAVQKDAIVNHVAIVKRGRAGSACRIGDSWNEFNDHKEPYVALKTVTIQGVADGMPFEVTDAAEAVINRLVEARDSLKAELADAVKDLTDATAAHDKAIAAKDAEIDAAKAQVVDQAQIDALADAKAEVVTLAKSIMGDSLETAGKTVADIRREVVAAKGVTVDGKSDDYVEAYFDTLKPEVTDAFRETVKDGVKTNDVDKAVTDARSAMIDRLFNPLKADA